jgi:hypothetical protein
MKEEGNAIFLSLSPSAPFRFTLGLSPAAAAAYAPERSLDWSRIGGVEIEIVKRLMMFLQVMVLTFGF